MIINRFMALAIILWTSQPAHSADAGYCATYARGLARILIPYVIRRAESTCGNSESEPALPPDWITALHLVDPDYTPIMPLDQADVANLTNIGSLPINQKPPAVPAPPSARPVVQAAGSAPIGPAAAHPQALCSSHNLRTVYSGLSWRCVK